MMDMEREKEAFERYKFKDQYDELKAYYDEHEREHGYRYPSYSYDDEWETWLAAKAQAIPDGFVVVPKEPTQELLNKMQDFFVGAFETGLINLKLINNSIT